MNRPTSVQSRPTAQHRRVGGSSPSFRRQLFRAARCGYCTYQFSHRLPMSRRLKIGASDGIIPEQEELQVRVCCCYYFFGGNLSFYRWPAGKKYLYSKRGN